ncbi:MAG: hypothetical protein AAF224_05365 [Pseudomonadota bacterium]
MTNDKTKAADQVDDADIKSGAAGGKAPGKSETASNDDREARLAEALRANLRRRKAGKKEPH